MKEFKVNEHITLKLEKEKTNIYVNGKRFNQCKFLLLNIPVDDFESRDINSIDEAEKKLNASMEGTSSKKFHIPPETEFWGHCSNLQAWVESKYDTRLLHRKLAFPLLKALNDAGDSTARKVFREEIAQRFESGYLPVVEFLLDGNYLTVFTREELDTIFLASRENMEKNLKKTLKCEGASMNHTFRLLKKLIEAGNSPLKKLFIEELAKRLGKEKSLVKHLWKENYMDLLTEEERAGLFENINIKALDLSECGLINLPKSVSSLPSLQALKLHENGLARLPESITELTSLETLRLDGNRFSTLLESIDNLKSLKRLSLYRNKGKVLLESITKLSSLEILNLGDNELSTLPEFIGNLSSLKELYLDYNHLTILPESITELPSLEILHLDGNHISSLPESMGNLKSLKKLHLYRNKLTTLPDSMGDLSSLEELDVSWNEFTSFPESITRLKSLQILDLGGNHIKKLPKSIESLSSLQKLHLRHNQLKKLPETIIHLKSLIELDVRDNKRTIFPLTSS